MRDEIPVIAARHGPGLARGNASLFAGISFVMIVVLLAYPAGHWVLAVYALSFWHYHLYVLAYVFGAVSPPVFRRDAIAMKSVAMIALGWLYLSAPPDLLSLAVVAIGFALNFLAARALGAERTYYGHELAALAPRRVTAFPYSCVTHPMLLGNMAAFGGMLINTEFRHEWWPLAAMHVVLNLGLLVMERVVTPQRRRARSARSAGNSGSLVAAPDRGASAADVALMCAFAALGAVLGWQAGHEIPGINPLLGAQIGAAIAAYAFVMNCCYKIPAAPPGAAPLIQWEGHR